VALASLLARMHDEPGLASRLANAGRAVAEERYNASSVAAATRIVYEEVIGDAGYRRQQGQGT